MASMTILETLGLTIPIFERGAGGIPTTTFVTDLAPRVDSYEDTISATFGFESASVQLTTTVDEALDMLANWLMRSTTVSGPDAETIWEGALIGVEAQFGPQEKRSVNLEKLANRVRARYTTVLDTPGVTTAVSDSASIALYGTKDTVLSLSKTTAAGAANEAAGELARRKNPVGDSASEIATGERAEEVRVTLSFAGWYDFLEWLLTSNSTTSTAVTTTQVGTLLTTAAATNAFVATSTTNITTSGISDTQYIAPDTTIRDAIEQLLRQGNSTGQRLAWGVYEDRKLTVRQWAGATPTTIGYRRFLGDHRLYDSLGGIVKPWNVRPDAMLEVPDLLDVAPVSTAADAAARMYIERVRFFVSNDRIGVSLEPQASDSMDARLARLQ